MAPLRPGPCGDSLQSWKRNTADVRWSSLLLEPIISEAVVLGTSRLGYKKKGGIMGEWSNTVGESTGQSRKPRLLVDGSNIQSRQFWAASQEDKADLYGLYCDVALRWQF